MKKVFAVVQQRDSQHQSTWVVLMDGQPSLWDEVAQVLGSISRVEILDLSRASGYLWEAVHGVALATL